MTAKAVITLNLSLVRPIVLWEGMLPGSHEYRLFAISCRARSWSGSDEVTERLIERILDVGPAMVSEPVRVTLRSHLQ